jgi:hypothetical protein
MAQAGDIANTNFIVRSFQVDANQSIDRGDVIVIVEGKARKATSNDDGPFAIAVESVTTSSNDVKYVRACISGLVYVIADGTIRPFRPVKVGSPGKVVEDTRVTISNEYSQQEIQELQNTFWKRVGVYIGKENEHLTVSDAHQGEVILIKL